MTINLYSQRKATKGKHSKGCRINKPSRIRFKINIGNTLNRIREDFGKHEPETKKN